MLAGFTSDSVRVISSLPEQKKQFKQFPAAWFLVLFVVLRHLWDTTSVAETSYLHDHCIYSWKAKCAGTDLSLLPYKLNSKFGFGHGY